MDAYQTEKSDEQRRTADLAAKILPYLGGGWSMDVQGNDGWDRVQAQDGDRRLQFVLNESTHRVNITGLCPISNNGNTYHNMREVQEYKTEISASMKKTPQVIGRDILRRLLPSYDAALVLVLKAIRDRDAYEAKKATFEAAVAGAFHEQVSVSKYCYGQLYQGPRVTARVKSADTARIELRLKGDAETVAKKITALIALMAEDDTDGR